MLYRLRSIPGKLPPAALTGLGAWRRLKWTEADLEQGALVGCVGVHVSRIIANSPVYVVTQQGEILSC